MAALFRISFLGLFTAILAVGWTGSDARAADSAIAKQCADSLQQVRMWLRTSLPPVSEADKKKIADAIDSQLETCAKAEAAHPEDGAVLLNHAYANFAAKRMDEAVQRVEKAAELGHAPAQVALARLVMKGKYVIADLGRAQRLIDSASKSDHVGARMQAAMEFMPGRIGPESPARAKRIFEELIEAGSTEAMMVYATKMLGIVRPTGTAKPETVEKGLALIRRAIELKDTGAMIYLALAHLQGKIVPVDMDQAAALANRAIEAGAGRGYGTMGQIFQKKGDYATAADWFRKGAEAGDAFSQTMYGFMFSGGFGVKQDLDKAVEWWTKARWNGDRLGASYLKVHRERMAALEAQEKSDKELLRKHQEQLKKDKAAKN